LYLRAPILGNAMLCISINMTPLRTAFALLLALGAVAGLAQTVASLPAHPLLETKLVGRTLLTINRGDLDSPALSPDGTRLAYVSKFITKDKFGLADIFVRDLRTSRTVRFVNSRRLTKLMGEKSNLYVTLRWVANDRLMANVGDGDEGGMDVTFESSSGRVLTKKYWNGPGGDTEEKASDPKLKQAFAQLGGDPDSLLQAAAEEIKTGAHNIVAPVGMTDGHRELWSLDTRSQRYRRVVADLSPYSVSGGFGAGKWAVALLSNSDQTARSAQLLAWNGSTIFRSPDLQLEYRPQDYFLDYAWTKDPFSIFSLAEGELGSRAFFLWDGARFYYINDIDSISPPTIDAAGQKICEVISEKNHNVIVMKELRLPNKNRVSRRAQLNSRQPT
jgi:hypothetical protein